MPVVFKLNLNHFMTLLMKKYRSPRRPSVFSWWHCWLSGQPRACMLNTG